MLINSEPSENLPEKVPHTTGGVLKAPSKFTFFSKRFLAGLIDGLAVGAISAAAVAMIILVFSSRTGWQVAPLALAQYCALSFAIGSIDVISACGLIVVVAMVLGALIPSQASLEIWLFASLLPLAVNHLYHFLYEYSPQASTPGKALTGLKLTGYAGRRLAVGSLLCRTAFKGLTTIACLVPFVHLIYANRDQMIHDRIIGSFVTSIDRKDFSELTPGKQASTWPSASLQTASVTRRVIASVLDSTLYCGLAQILLSVALLSLAHTFAKFNFANSIEFILTLNIVVPLLTGLLTTLIFAALEASSLQATPGKVVAGIKVIALDGNKINYGQALIKQLNQGIAYVSLYPIIAIAYLAGIALPAMSSTLICCAYVLFYLIYGFILCVSFKNGQTLLDRTCERLVVRNLPVSDLPASDLPTSDLPTSESVALGTAGNSSNSQIAEQWRIEK